MGGNNSADNQVTYPSLAVIIAAYNEEQGIGLTIHEIIEEISDPHIVVVDGNSSDKTSKLAKNLGADVITQKGEGKGSAILQGLNHINEKFSYVAFIDADYTYPANYIKKMILIIKNNPKVGMVLGNRFSPKYEIESDRNQFYLGNKILALIQNVFYNSNLVDPLTGLRVIRFELVNGWKPKSKGFGIEVELNYFIEQLGFKIVETPIIYRKRVGKKKLGFKHGFEIFARIVIESLRN